MQPEHVIAFNITLLAAMASPGPALVVAIRTVLSAGGRAGIAIGCGLGIAAAGWTLAALVGLDAVFRLFPWSYMLVKIVGGLYLSYLAYGIWKAAPQPVAEAEIPAGLIDLIRNGKFSAGQRVLFWHTGGAAALFGYDKALTA